jgi:hypothetical protein
LFSQTRKERSERGTRATRRAEYTGPATTNPLHSELYVSGIDETVVVNLTTRAVSHRLGPGRLTGFKVAPNGEWAAGVDVFHEEIFVYDLHKRSKRFTLPD